MRLNIQSGAWWVLVSAKILSTRSAWYDGPNAASNAIGYASQYSRSHGAVIRVYDDAGNVIETHEHAGELKEW